MDPADDGGAGARIGLTLLLGGIAALGSVDLVLDHAEAGWSLHTAVEAAFVALCLGGVAFLWRGWVGAQRGLARSARDLADREADRDAWRARARRLLAGLGAEIESQFERWALTPAEQEVALLLLKGLGHKEIAATTGRSERTVRQHAVAVYRKAGLAGRAELAAFFLEDLLLPRVKEDEITEP